MSQTQEVTQTVNNDTSFPKAIPAAVEVTQHSDNVASLPNNRGNLARQIWNGMAKRWKQKKPPKILACGLNFEQQFEALTIATAQSTKNKQQVQKKRKPVINIRTLLILKAIADGKYDRLVSFEQKYQIQRNSEERNKLIKKYFKHGEFPKTFWFYKWLKPRWFRLEKRCVTFLYENEIEIDLFAVLTYIERQHLKDERASSTPGIKAFNDNYYVEDNKKCEELGSRPISALSGGSSNALFGESSNPSSSSSSESDSDGDSYHSSIPPKPFSSDDEDFVEEEEDEEKEVESEEKKSKDANSSDSDESDGEQQTPFNYKAINPQRNCTKEGIFSLNCKQRLNTGQYKNILRQAAEHPEICYKEYPRMFSEPGTLLVFNVEQVQRKWDLKDLSMAQSEVRADGWSWIKSTGASKREGTRDDPMPVVVDHFRGRNKDDGRLETELPFDLWQYTTTDNRYQLLHYLGNTENIAAGYPHGNSLKGIPISRSTRSNIQKLIKESVDQKPTDVVANYWREMEEDVARDLELTLVKGPRNEKQVQNARQRALNQARFSTNTIDNISTMGLRLRFPGYFLQTGKSKSSSSHPRSFIDVLGLTDTNLYVYFENPLLFEELGNVMKETGTPMKLYYDTKFRMGDFYLSILSWEHPYFKKQIVLAGYIHDDKGHPRHEDFFRRIWKNNERYLKGGRFVLVTDGEFRLTNIWPRLTNLYCFNHLTQNLERSLKGKGRKYKQICVKLFGELQKKETEKSFKKKLKRCLDVIDSKKASKIFKYYGNKLLNRSSRWAILKCKLPDETLLTNRAESVNAMIDRYKHKNSLFADEMLVILFFITQDQYGKIKKGYYRIPQGYVLADDYLDKARGEPRQAPAIPYVPALTEIVPFLKDKSSLPLMPGMQRTGPLVKNRGQSNPNTLNSMAKDLVLKKRVKQDADNEKLFQVLDLGDNYHAVYLKDRDLSKQNYTCSCSAKDCVHLRAVFLFLDIPPEDIPFIANRDPLQLLKRQRNKNRNETAAGRKAPRRGESTKDYRSEDEDEDDEDSGSAKRRKTNEEDHDEQQNDFHNFGSFDDNFYGAATQPSGTHEDEQYENSQDGVQVQAIIEAANVPRIEADERELRKEIKTKYELYKKISSPPELTQDAPQWWHEIATALNDILIYKEIFKPNFFNPLPVIPEGKAIVFVTADDYPCVCYREKANKVSVYSMDNVVPENTPEEMSFSAAHCVRDQQQEAVVNVFNSVDNVNGKHPLFLASLKLKILSDLAVKPEDVMFDLSEVEEYNFATLNEVRLIGDTNFETELKTFLVQMGATKNTISKAKQSFIQAVYNRRNLFGTEDELVFSKLLKVCGVDNEYNCPQCSVKTRRDHKIKTFIGTHSITNNSVAETIENVFNLRNVVMPEIRCPNEYDGKQCNAKWEISDIKYATPHPWVIPIGLANENTNRIFGFKELEQLPSKVQVTENTTALKYI
uniref:SWIM-type domain-containing protein n=1 Tax=Panagrolaimus davidi TaxID=227884 RepID=A0A914P4U2_9BILA